MSLSFFADQCVPSSVVRALRDAGHDVAVLREHLPPNAPDPLVLQTAQEMGCMLVSLNGDFADIVSYPPATHRGIIALQVRNRPEAIPQMLDRLTTYVHAHPDADHYVGKLLLVESHRIRIRT